MHCPHFSFLLQNLEVNLFRFFEMYHKCLFSFEQKYLPSMETYKNCQRLHKILCTEIDVKGEAQQQLTASMMSIPVTDTYLFLYTKEKVIYNQTRLQIT